MNYFHIINVLGIDEQSEASLGEEVWMGWGEKGGEGNELKSLSGLLEVGVNILDQRTR